MSDVKTKGSLKFVTHRPKDKSDPGFKIVGAQLRWLASSQTEDRPGRIFRILRKTDLPPEIIKQMHDFNPEMFNKDGIIRNRELVLAWAPSEKVAEAKKELEMAAKAQFARITSKANPGNNRNMKVHEAEISQGNTEEFFNS